MPDDGKHNVTPEMLKLAKQRLAIDKKRQSLNDDAAAIAANVKKLGIHPTAFRHSIAAVKLMDKDESDDYVESMEYMVEELRKEEKDLFADEIEARRKKREAAAAKAARAADPGDKTAPDSPRGDPAKGGAGGVDGKKAAKDGKPKAVEPKVAGRKPGRPKKGGDNVVPIGAKKAGKIDVVSQSGVTAEDVPLVAADVQAKEQAEGGKLLDDAVEGIKEREAEERAAFSDLTGTGDEPPPEDGDALIKRVAAQKNAELEARGGMDGMAPIDASGDDGPLSQSQIAAQRREAAFGSGS